jgi:hypothetical protein
MNQFPFDAENDLPEFTNEQIEKMLAECDREVRAWRAQPDINGRTLSPRLNTQEPPGG